MIVEGGVFQFDEQMHRYTVDGVELPGITSLLKPLTKYDDVPEFMLKKKAAFGRGVHKLVEIFLKGNDESTNGFSADVWRCFNGFVKFWGEHPKWHDAPRIIERPMYHPKLKYAGTPDIILDGVAIIELKTREFHKATDPLQLIAQENLHIANGGKKMSYPKFVLELHKDGTTKLVPASHTQAWPRFRYLVDHYWRGVEYQKNIAVWRG